jgi:predicted HTH transcriptional regulator
VDYKEIKKHANEILQAGVAECSFIEYKKSCEQLPKILKTICAYGNNYYDNDIQYIFLGVEEKNDEHNKAIPITPITGIEEGAIEKCKNKINALRPYLYPNVSFDIISNEFDGRKYLLIVVQRQTGGPFMVNEKAEENRNLRLKPGRYIRIESDSRLARVDEEYDLLRKFSNFHYSSLTNQEATINDLDVDYLTEYLQKTSDRKIMGKLDKFDIAKALKLVDKNDPSSFRIRNYAVLMFCSNPEQFIPYAYSELIVDMFGTKRLMESKKFTGPIWKQYQNIVNYINDNFLNLYILRQEGEAENRQLSNFPFVAVEELVANAIVHNNYENAKPIQIYVSEKQINIVNYNKPLPPLSIEDLNERRVFNERDTENPEIRDMFKALGIIESFGTGIGEAKRSMEENGSPSLYYKEFSESYNVTSVVIPVNEEYLSIKTGTKAEDKKEVKIKSEGFKDKILNSNYPSNVKNNLLTIYNNLQSTVFGNADIMRVLDCSETTATLYLKKLSEELQLTVAINGQGKGKYCFRQEYKTTELDFQAQPITRYLHKCQDFI